MSLRPIERMEARRSKFKATFDAVDGRCRREEGMVEIRKNKRESLNNKMRHARPSPQSIPAKLQSIETIAGWLYSDDGLLQFQAVLEIRSLLCGDAESVTEVIEADFVPRLLEFLWRDDSPELQFEAIGALSDIACATRGSAHIVISYGALPPLVDLLWSPDEYICEQATWALGNIAGDCSMCQEEVLKSGALMPLLEQFNRHRKPSMLSTSWALVNFCMGCPPELFWQIKPLLGALANLIYSDDEFVLDNTSRAIGTVSGIHAYINAVIETGICVRLVELFMHSLPSVAAYAVATVNNIVKADVLQIQIIIDHQALPSLLYLIKSNPEKEMEEDITAYACQIISSITAGNKDQIQAVIDSDIIAGLLHLIQTTEFSIKRLAAFAISNAISGGSHDQIKYLVSQGCIKPLCDLLLCHNLITVRACLEALEKMLKIGENEKNLGTTGGIVPYRQMIVEAGGLEKIEILLGDENKNKNDVVYQKAVQILELYWPEEDED